jgi:hypothetical protein
MMFIVFSPVHYNQYAQYSENTLPNTTFKVVDDDTLEYDGQEVVFPTGEVSWPEISVNTHGKIEKAFRDDNSKIHLMVRILYTKTIPRIADLQEHEIQDGETL